MEASPSFGGNTAQPGPKDDLLMTHLLGSSPHSILLLSVSIADTLLDDEEVMVIVAWSQPYHWGSVRSEYAVSASCTPIRAAMNASRSHTLSAV